jgi:hypothetical protein
MIIELSTRAVGAGLTIHGLRDRLLIHFVTRLNELVSAKAESPTPEALKCMDSGQVRDCDD